MQSTRRQPFAYSIYTYSLWTPEFLQF
jgi:hypothetical protein